MKKLLALILCVMMFVAVIPTAAFADAILNPQTYNSNTTPRWAAAADAKKAVDHASDAIKAMYGGLAANEGVFATVKGIDGVISDMAKGMFEGVDEVDLTVLGSAYGKYSNDQAVNKTKHLVRELVGSEIMKYMDDHRSAYTKYKDDGTTPKGVDPVKYLNTFATAASKAMSSEKAAKNLEAVMYTLALAKTFKQASDDMKDFRTTVLDWDDTILAEYGFSNSAVAGTFFDPYAFLDPTDISFSDINGDKFTGATNSIIDTWNNIAE